MSGQAQVRSTDSIEGFNAALARFAERLQTALDTLDGELHRADDWIEHNRPSFWKAQERHAEDQLHQAKLDLERALLMITADGQRPACREQKAAVELAKARLEYCRDKADRVKHWQRSFRHEMFEFDGRIGQLRGLLDHQIPHARAVLLRILRRIEEYQVEQAPDLSALSHSAAELPLPPVNPPKRGDASPASDPAADSVSQEEPVSEKKHEENVT
jgi:hypothetical protein